MFYHNCHDETWKEGRAYITDYADTPCEKNMVSLADCTHQGQGQKTALQFTNVTEDRYLSTLDATYHHRAINPVTCQHNTASPRLSVIRLAVVCAFGFQFHNPDVYFRVHDLLSQP